MIKKHIILTLFLTCFLTVLFYTSTAICGTLSKTAPAQIWNGEMTGTIKGRMTINAWPDKINDDEMIFESKVKMKLKATNGYGSGYAKGIITGRIKDGLFNGQFKGMAHVSEGSAVLKGKMVGSLSGSQGLGTYKFTARGGYYSGEWTLEKQEIKIDK